MAKLKALRGAVGAYGRVAAGGIIDVDEGQAGKLIKTARFVRASDSDIEAAQEAQKLALTVSGAGSGAAFMPVPERAQPLDRLSQMIDSGQITRDKAKELTSLQISLSTDEVKAFIKAEADRLYGEIAAEQEKLSAREDALVERAAELAARETEFADAVERQTKELLAKSEDLGAREKVLAERDQAGFPDCDDPTKGKVKAAVDGKGGK